MFSVVFIITVLFLLSFVTYFNCIDLINVALLYFVIFCLDGRCNEKGWGPDGCPALFYFILLSVMPCSLWEFLPKGVKEIHQRASQKWIPEQHFARVSSKQKTFILDLILNIILNDQIWWFWVMRRHFCEGPVTSTMDTNTLCRLCRGEWREERESAAPGEWGRVGSGGVWLCCAGQSPHWLSTGHQSRMAHRLHPCDVPLLPGGPNVRHYLFLPLGQQSLVLHCAASP